MSITSSRTATTVDKATTAVLSVLPGLRWHQIDAGVATTGSLAVNANFGAETRTIATIDFTETDRVPILVFGDVKSISLVPTGVNVNYLVTYIATEV